MREKQKRPQATTKRSGTRKLNIGDRVRVTTHASADYRQRAGFITEIGPGQAEYRIEFDDGHQPTTGYIKADCLQRAR